MVMWMMEWIAAIRRGMRESHAGRGGRVFRSRFSLAAGLVLVTTLITPGCSSLVAALPTALEFASNMLNAAGQNHSAKYANQLGRLLNTFVDAGRKPGQLDGGPAALAPLPEPPAPDPAPLELDVALLKVAGAERAGINDGDTLRDGNGEPNAADAFTIRFRPNRDCHVYAVLIDSTGLVQPLRPVRPEAMEAFAAAGRDHVLPGGENVYELDRNKGIEHVYLVASRERDPRIEEALRPFYTRPRGGAVRAAVTEPTVVPSATRRSAKTARRGPDSLPGADAATYFSERGADLVITRWFRHE